MGILYHQFQMDKQACRYVFKSGKIAEFIGGLYRTTVKSEIEELQAEIDSGIGSIWVPPEAPTIDSEDMDPVAVMKKKVIAEYLAQQARAQNNGESTSESDPKTGMGNTKNLAAVSAGSTSGATATAVPPGSITAARK
jgi:hypothetical protein